MATGGNRGGRLFRGIYDEARRGKFLNTAQPNADIRALLKENQWNKYRIVCQGSRIQVWSTISK